MVHAGRALWVEGIRAQEAQKAQALCKSIRGASTTPFFSNSLVSDRLPFVTMVSRSSSAVISRKSISTGPAAISESRPMLLRKWALGSKPENFVSGAIHQVGAVVQGHGSPPARTIRVHRGAENSPSHPNPS